MSKKLKRSLLATVFILGYGSLSFELILLRQLINFVGSNTLVTSIIISVIMLFLCLGYYIGSTISLNKRPLRIIIEQIVSGLSVWYILACSYFIMGGIFYLLVYSQIISPVIQVMIISLLLSALPSVGLGFITSYFGRIIHHFDSDYTGRFMAVDTIGSVSGSLLTTLVLMPLFGVASATTFLVFLTSAVAILVAKRKDILLYIILCGLLTAMAYIVAHERLWNPESTLILDNAIARVEIYDTDEQNGKAQTKEMQINGSNSSKISTNSEYMYAYVDYINRNFIEHLPTNKVNDILILGAGGFTVGLNDTRNNYVYIDVIKELQQISEERFLDSPLSSNKKFIAQDAYLYMLRNAEKFDVILVDVYASTKDIPINFVTADFFKMIKAHLRKDGIMIANIITSGSFKSKYSRRVDNTLRSVFKHSLSRQVVTSSQFNPYADETQNVIYVYYNRPDDDEIYTIDTNSAVFGQ